MINNLVSRRGASPVAPATGSGRVIPARVRPQTSQTYYPRNQQYSILGLTNAAGTLVERYTYSAYGTLGIYAANGTVRSSSTYANRYTYTGREWDGELRLYHFRARWYDPATGGFVTRDPLGYVDGMSLYRGYFGVDGVDPSGQNGMCRMQLQCELIKNAEIYHATMAVRMDFAKKDCFYECTEIVGTATSGASAAGASGTGEAFGCEDVKPNPFKTIRSVRLTGLFYCNDCQKDYTTTVELVEKTVYPDCNPFACRKACDEGVGGFKDYCYGSFPIRALCSIAIEGFNVTTCHALCNAACKGSDRVPATDRQPTVDGTGESD